MSPDVLSVVKTFEGIPVLKEYPHFFLYVPSLEFSAVESPDESTNAFVELRPPRLLELLSERPFGDSDRQRGFTDRRPPDERDVDGGAFLCGELPGFPSKFFLHFLAPLRIF